MGIVPMLLLLKYLRHWGLFKVTGQYLSFLLTSRTKTKTLNITMNKITLFWFQWLQLK